MFRRNSTSIVVVLAVFWVASSSLEPRGTSASTVSNPPSLWPVPDFQFVDQLGRAATRSDLLGSVWICDFFLTNCFGQCPRMTEKLQALQQRLPDPLVKFVSISIDPMRDTPEVLLSYAQKIDADPSRWLFVTSEASQLFETARAMGLAGGSGPQDSVVLHSDRFFLIDQSGIVRGVYDSNSERQLSQLVADVAKVSAETTNRAPQAGPPSELFSRFFEPGATNAEAMARDLVCNMDVAACSISPSVVHDGRSYYFCSDACKATFERSPAKFLQYGR